MYWIWISLRIGGNERQLTFHFFFACRSRHASTCRNHTLAHNIIIQFRPSTTAVSISDQNFLYCTFVFFSNAFFFVSFKLSVLVRHVDSWFLSYFVYMIVTQNAQNYLSAPLCSACFCCTRVDWTTWLIHRYFCFFILHFL